MAPRPTPWSLLGGEWLSEQRRCGEGSPRRDQHRHRSRVQCSRASSPAEGFGRLRRQAG